MQFLGGSPLLPNRFEIEKRSTVPYGGQALRTLLCILLLSDGGITEALAKRADERVVERQTADSIGNTAVELGGINRELSKDQCV